MVLSRDIYCCSFLKKQTIILGPIPSARVGDNISSWFASEILMFHCSVLRHNFNLLFLIVIIIV